MNRLRATRSHVGLAFLTGFVTLLGFACESAPALRNPRCAKHPPEEVFRSISPRLLWSVYYDIPSEKCVVYSGPTQGGGAKNSDEFRARFTPFYSVEECLTVCHEPQPCDPDNPCPPFEYTNSWPPYDTYPQTCVWVSSEGRGYCALQCQSQGLDVKLEHFGWSVGTVCPDGLSCSAVAPGSCYPCQEYAEACVLPE